MTAALIRAHAMNNKSAPGFDPRQDEDDHASSCSLPLTTTTISCMLKNYGYLVSNVFMTLAEFCLGTRDATPPPLRIGGSILTHRLRHHPDVRVSASSRSEKKEKRRSNDDVGVALGASDACGRGIILEL